ncbi:hypothetical protein V2I01_13180 [Micromonospora sp. BRA006-A]|nr:hypothetical protein [Micromonospora sp. BRA006-A]
MVDIRLLGVPEVWRGAAPLPLGTPKQQTALAVLVLHRGQLVTVDTLVDELWPTTRPAPPWRTCGRTWATFGGRSIDTTARPWFGSPAAIAWTWTTSGWTCVVSST